LDVETYSERSMTPQTAQRMLAFIKLASQYIGALHEKVAAQEAKIAAYDAKEKKAEALIPGVIDVMVASEVLQENERTKAANVLKDSAAVLEVLANTAKRRSATELAHMGQPETKTASANGAAPAEKESDNVWFKALNVR